MSDPHQRRFRINLAVPLSLTLTLSLAVCLLIVTGCTLVKPEPPPDTLAAFRPALQQDVQVSQVVADSFNVYSITVRIDPATRVYTGTADISVPITGTLPTTELYFRLYPNLPFFGGSMEVTMVRANGVAVNYGYAADQTAVHLITPKPWEQGRPVNVRLGFIGRAPERSDTYYTLFGTNRGILNLTDLYPILAARRDGAWVLDIADPQGDIGFSDVGLYRVSVTVPSDQVIAATGTAISTKPADDGWTTTTYLQGPAREFTLAMSADYQVLETVAYGTLVRSYYLKGHEDGGRSALYNGAAALMIYSDRFGHYPYRTMSIVEAPITYRGMEFPGLILIGTDTYDQFKQDQETRVSHEMAHQWWYSQVGNDQINSPWLDEGLTEFSMYYYYADRYGPPIGDALRRSRWETPVNVARTNNTEQPIGLPVKAYQSNYEAMIYAKGALFFAVLRDRLGPDAFQELLRRYIKQYQWQIATPEEFQALAEGVAGEGLDPLFREWLQGQ